VSEKPELVVLFLGLGGVCGRYDFVPQEIAEKVIAAHKPHHEEEHEAATA